MRPIFVPVVLARDPFMRLAAGSVFQASVLSEIPTDPYSDRPMRMTTVDGQPVVYSVGLDGKDDRARTEWGLGTRNPTGDLLFRLSVTR
ncbi:MAG: hypothetical protein JW888_00780 [Pirellulales bacterium]|nr:hypothetical protein [Pirellulales bacterium]